MYLFLQEYTNVFSSLSSKRRSNIRFKVSISLFDVLKEKLSHKKTKNKKINVNFWLKNDIWPA